jgi:hypothetical protein
MRAAYKLDSFLQSAMNLILGMVVVGRSVGGIQTTAYAA